MLSLERPTNKQPLRDVIEEEFSHEEPQVDQLKSGKANPDRISEQIPQFPELQKSSSLLPPS